MLRRFCRHPYQIPGFLACNLIIHIHIHIHKCSKHLRPHKPSQASEFILGVHIIVEAGEYIDTIGKISLVEDIKYCLIV